MIYTKKVKQRMLDRRKHKVTKKRNKGHKKSPKVAPAEAKVFMSGRSQAVRIPKQFRVATDTVYIKRLGSGLLLVPKTRDRWTGLFAALDQFPRDFTLDRNQEQPARVGLDDLFGEK